VGGGAGGVRPGSARGGANAAPAGSSGSGGTAGGTDAPLLQYGIDVFQRSVTTAVRSVGGMLAVAATTVSGAISTGASMVGVATPTAGGTPSGSPGAAADSRGGDVQLQPGVGTEAAERAQKEALPFITRVAPDDIASLPVTDKAWRDHVPDQYIFGLRLLKEVADRQLEAALAAAMGHPELASPVHGLHARSRAASAAHARGASDGSTLLTAEAAEEEVRRAVSECGSAGASPAGQGGARAGFAPGAAAAPGSASGASGEAEEEACRAAIRKLEADEAAERGDADAAVMPQAAAAGVGGNVRPARGGAGATGGGSGPVVPP
jgi:hypothetical protein